MKVFARLTAIIFLILGIIIIFSGIAFAVSGITGQAAKSVTPTPSIIPDFSGLIVIAKIFGGAAIGFQGLVLSAIGEVLWLLTDIANNTERTSQSVFSLLRKTGQQN
jgi:lysylphosphatidylglycerol synthetase-like protein (DUF2156 family)